MSNFSKIDVAILVGGLGTRLQSKSMGKPKALAEVRNHPFLEYLLSQVGQAGFKNIILCIGYLGDLIERRIGDKYQKLNIKYSSEKSPLGTGGGLRKALPLLNSETVLVMNGDSFCDVDFKKFWEFHKNKKSRVSIVLTKVPGTSRFGIVKLGSDENIIKFQEKKENKGPGFINAGIYLVNKELIATITEEKQVSIEKDIFPNWIGKGFYGYKSGNSFIDIGTSESYDLANDFFSKYKL